MLCPTQMQGEFPPSFNCGEVCKVYGSCAVIPQTNDTHISYFQPEVPCNYRYKKILFLVVVKSCLSELNFLRPQGTVGYTHTHTHTHSCVYIYKVKWFRYRLGVAQKVSRGITVLFHDCGTRRSEWSATRPGRNLLTGKTWYPLQRRLGGRQGRSGRAENLVLTRIRSRTVQPVVSR